MAPNTKGDRNKGLQVDLKNWHSLSLDAVRVWVILFVVTGGLIVGFYGYRYLQSLSTERQAMIVIEEAAMKLGRVQREATGGTGSSTYNEGWQHLQQARQELAMGEFKAALVSARWSRNLLSSLLDDLGNRAPTGEAQFVGVQGGVEFRRGDGPWQIARSRIVLHSGDYVKTSGKGSADVAFSDGTSFSVRPDTVVLISRQRSEGGVQSEDAVTLEYGWINLDTASRPSRIRTPEAEARVGEDSSVELTYDRDRRASRFASHQGWMEVRSRVGTIRRLGSQELVTMSATGMSQAKKLPDSPDPMWPSPAARFQLADEEVVLRWQQVDGATRYALQICGDRFFIDNVIDVEDRTANSARVGFVGEGEFLWRVAAFNRQGLKGPWSEPRTFEVEDSPTGS